jgi:MFS transporter, Spinster family, sphingosine-1-phosphate transporter
MAPVLDSRDEPVENRPRKLGSTAHLVIFCACQVAVYFDRGVIAGLLSYMKKEVHGINSDFQAGLVPGIFMVGYMFTSPFFVRLSQVSEEWQVYSITMGLGCLVLASLLTYFVSSSYAGILVARLLSGAGEAAFCSLAPAIIDNAAPFGKKSFYVGIYFSFLYVGFGLGNGVCALFSTWDAGRILFLGEAALIAACIAILLVLRKRLCLVVSDPDNVLDDQSVSRVGLLAQIKTVMSQVLFVLLCVGYGMFFFTFGGLASWLPTYLKNTYIGHDSMADMGLGVTICLTGIVGTGSGGLLMDLVCKRVSQQTRFVGFNTEYIRVFSGAVISAALACVAMIFTVPALYSPSISVFFIFFAIGCLLMCSITAPINTAIMHSVPFALKAQSMALSIALSHLIGDFPSPFVIGALMDATNYKTAILVTSSVLVVPTILWMVAAWKAYTMGKAQVTVSDVELQLKRQMTQAVPTTD